MSSAVYAALWSALGLMTIGATILLHALERPVPLVQDLWIGGAVFICGVLTGLRGCGVGG